MQSARASNLPEAERALRPVPAAGGLRHSRTEGSCKLTRKLQGATKHRGNDIQSTRRNFPTLLFRNVTEPSSLPEFSISLVRALGTSCPRFREDPSIDVVRKITKQNGYFDSIIGYRGKATKATLIHVDLKFCISEQDLSAGNDEYAQREEKPRKPARRSRVEGFRDFPAVGDWSSKVLEHDERSIRKTGKHIRNCF